MLDTGPTAGNGRAGVGWDGPVGAALVLASGLRGDEPPGQFEVQDVSLWIVELGGQMANYRSAYPSALPVTVNSVRSAPVARTRSSVCAVRLASSRGVTDR